MGRKETIIFLINHNKLKELETMDKYNLLSLNPSLIAKNSPRQVRKKKLEYTPTQPKPPSYEVSIAESH